MQRTNSSEEEKTIYLWWVPLTYTADFKTVAITWLADNQTSETVTLDLNVSNDQWVIFNINETGKSNLLSKKKMNEEHYLNHLGFYRVNYDQRNWYAQPCCCFIILVSFSINEFT